MRDGVGSSSIKSLSMSCFMYNLSFRINGDLLMWEPQAPSPITSQEPFAYSIPLEKNAGIPPGFQVGSRREKLAGFLVIPVKSRRNFWSSR